VYMLARPTVLSPIDAVLDDSASCGTRCGRRVVHGARRHRAKNKTLNRHRIMKANRNAMRTTAILRNVTI